MDQQDALTGLWNRGTYDAHIQEKMMKAHRDQQPLSLVIVDIDKFKKVNDTHGHQTGDLVLAEVARRLKTVTDGKGEAYRYGGEEIAILLPNHTIQEAITVAERARRDLESNPIQGIQITASFGIGSYPIHGKEPADLFKAADAAMYDAKNRGRNLVRVYGEPEPDIEKPREPERKLPEPGLLTEDQRRELYLDHYRGITIRCPNDEAILRTQNIFRLSKDERSHLLVVCPVCGLRDQIPPP